MKVKHKETGTVPIFLSPMIFRDDYRRSLQLILEAGLFTVALVVCSHIKWPGQEAPIAISPTLINLIISTSILHSSNFYIQIICIK